MSQHSHVSQTGTILNISTNHETPVNSSPTAEKAPPADIVREDTEIVEDSLKYKVATTKHEHVRPSQQAQAEDDDLYSLTPARPSQATGKILPREPQESRTPTQPAAQTRKASLNAVDVLLARGAIVHKASVAKQSPANKTADTRADADEDELQRSEGNRSVPLGAPAAARKSAAKAVQRRSRAGGQPDPDGEEDDLQSPDNNVNPHLSAHPRSPRKVAKPLVPSKAVAAPKSTTAAPMATRAAVTNLTGALGALRQRRGESMAPANTPKPVNNNGSAVLQPRDPNVQTPAIRTKDGPESIQNGPVTTTAGKLRPVSKVLLAQTHMGAATRAHRAPPAKRKMGSPRSADNKIAAGSVSKTAKEGSGQKAKGTLKRPAQAMKAPKTDPASTYDLPSSPDGEDEEVYKPSRRTRKSKAGARKRVVASSPQTGSPAAATKKPAARKPKGKAKVATEQDDAEGSRTGPATSTRARMKAESGAVTPALVAKKDDGANNFTKKKGQQPPMLDEIEEDEQNTIATLPLPAKPDQSDRQAEQRRRQEDATIVIKKEKATKMAEYDQPQQRSAEDTEGASQQNAIMLSDGEASSEDELVSEQGENQPVPAEDAAGARRIPRTPAALRSSPPAAVNASTKPTTAGLIDPQSARKSTIISFDQSGPRNQGTASNRAGRSSLAPVDRLSLPVGQSAGSVAMLHARRQGLLSSAAKSNKTFEREHSAAPSYLAESAEEALAGFGKPTTGRGQREASARVQAPALPVLRLQNDDPEDDYMHVDDLAGDTFVQYDREQSEPQRVDPVRAPRTLSQAQMPPPKTKAEGKRPVAAGAPIVPNMLQPPQRVPTQTTENVVLGKRQQPHEPNIDVPLKRMRKEAAAEQVQHQQSGSLDSSMGVALVRRKPSPKNKTAKAPQQRAGSQRQAGRQKSQGTVDIHGSPVPEGMVVGGFETVLETFSQQAGLSSDQVNAEGNEFLDQTNKTNYGLAAKPHLQQAPARLSSNTKVLPADPGEESQAITHIARVRSGRPFVTAETLHPPTDPFTSNEDGRFGAPNSSSTSAFSEQLRKHAVSAKKNAHVVQPEEQEEDPEKTLVEEEPQEPQPPHRKKQPKRIESFSTQSSSDASTDTEDTSTSQLDLSLWRNALKPHQMKLFDELVGISHKLVQHLVSKEEAAADIVNDYRSRGERLVESLQASQEKDVQVYVESLRERKRRLQRELADVSGRLEGQGEEVKEMRRELKQGLRVREEDAGLGDVMEAFG